MTLTLRNGVKRIGSTDNLFASKLETNRAFDTGRNRRERNRRGGQLVEVDSCITVEEWTYVGVIDCGVAQFPRLEFKFLRVRRVAVSNH